MKLIQNIFIALIFMITIFIAVWSCGDSSSDEPKSKYDYDYVLDKCDDEFDSRKKCKSIIKDFEDEVEDVDEKIDYECMAKQIDKSDDLEEYTERLYKKCCEDCDEPDSSSSSGSTSSTSSSSTTSSSSGGSSSGISSTSSTSSSSTTSSSSGGTTDKGDVSKCSTETKAYFINSIGMISYLELDGSNKVTWYSDDDGSGVIGDFGNEDKPAYVDNATIDETNNIVKMGTKIIGIMRCEKKDSKCRKMIYYNKDAEYALYMAENVEGDHVKIVNPNNSGVTAGSACD